MPQSREEIAAYQKEYRQKNKEKLEAYEKEYNQTPAGKRRTTISSWKLSGLIHDDYGQLYDEYLQSTNCERCGIKYGKYGDGTRTFRCMDHCHVSGRFRDFLCSNCNIERR